MFLPSRNLFACGLLILLLPFLGCGGSAENPEAKRTTANVEDRLQGIAILFLRNQGKLKDEDGYRAAFEKIDSEIKSRLHLTSPDELFVSPRDNEKFVINFTAKPGVPGSPDNAILAYEAIGVRGKRFVVNTAMDVTEIEDAEFRKLVPQ